MLDECDEMLNMGFVDDVELILNAGGAENIQTLLFSATLPSWVKDIQKRFLKKDFKLVDLVGNEKQKASSRSLDASPSSFDVDIAARTCYQFSTGFKSLSSVFSDNEIAFSKKVAMVAPCLDPTQAKL